jgi:hypothetical protein
MQETKLAAVSLYIVMETLGADFDAYLCLRATNTRGGIMVTWKSRVVQLDNAHVDSSSGTTQGTPPGAPWWLTYVCGPQDDVDNVAFLSEMRDVRRTHPGPWVLYHILYHIFFLGFAS